MQRPTLKDLLITRILTGRASRLRVAADNGDGKLFSLEAYE